MSLRSAETPHNCRNRDDPHDTTLPLPLSVGCCKTPKRDSPRERRGNPHLFPSAVHQPRGGSLCYTESRIKGVVQSQESRVQSSDQRRLLMRVFYRGGWGGTVAGCSGFVDLRISDGSRQPRWSLPRLPGISPSVRPNRSHSLRLTSAEVNPSHLRMWSGVRYRSVRSRCPLSSELQQEPTSIQGTRSCPRWCQRLLRFRRTVGRCLYRCRSERYGAQLSILSSPTARMCQVSSSNRPRRTRLGSPPTDLLRCKA